MGRKVVFVVLLMSCLFTIEAANSPANTKSSCVPGRFYEGPGCSKCYCNEKRTKVCGPEGICKLTGKGPTKAEIIHTFNHANIDKLRALPSQGERCTPGALYRVDCNRCICLERDSLMCERRLCPSYDDVNRLKATKMSGQPCVDDRVIREDCVECSCSNGQTVCQGKEKCVPLTKLSSKHLQKDGSKEKCTPGKRYRLKNTNRRCTCSKQGKLRCPGLEDVDPVFLKAQNVEPVFLKAQNAEPVFLKAQNAEPVFLKAQNVEPVFLKTQNDDPVFLKAEANKKCTPGVVSYDNCHMCTCLENGVQSCTPTTCLNDKQKKELSDRIKNYIEDQKEKKLVEETQQFDEEFLKPGGKRCTPGVVYQHDCNTCICTEDYGLECTLIACLGEQEKKKGVDKLAVDKSERN